MAEGWEEIAKFGKKVVSSGLTSSRFGNISLLKGRRILVTCTGTMLDELDAGQIVEVDLQGQCASEERASIETCVHRAIYRRTCAGAVIHTHSPFAVVLSLLEEGSVEPLDSEGAAFLGMIPIVEGPSGSEDLAEAVSLALKSHRACIARGHGVFAAGEGLLQAYDAACMAEHSSMVRYLVRAQSRL